MTPACLASELGAALPAAEKLEQVDSQLVHSGRVGRYSMPFGDKKAGTSDDKLLKVCRDSSKVAVEQVKGITSQVGRGQPCCRLGGLAGLYDGAVETYNTLLWGGRQHICTE